MTSCFEETESSTELEVFRSPEPVPWAVLERGDNVFFTEAYVRSWLAHLAAGEMELAVTRDGKVFPLFRSAERILGKTVSVWKSVGWNSAWYPYSFLPPDAGRVLPFLDYVAARQEAWDGVLVSCPAELRTAIESQAEERGWKTTLWSSKILPYVTVEGSWESYWSGLPKWLRVNVERFSKRAKKSGSLELRKVEDREDCDRLLRRFVDLHDARWSARGQRSKYVTRERHRRFLEEVVLGAQKARRLYFPYLALEGEPIAMAVCFLERGKLYYVWPTFDVDYASLAPGKLLLYHILRDAFASGVHEVDLGPGADAYKFYWTPRKREVAQLLLYRDSLRLWGSYHLVPRFRTAVRAGLEKTLGETAMRRVAGAMDRVGLGGS
jgi:CelD/BcsL family acetyltransferase involved in cellulose biosynthesis